MESGRGDHEEGERGGGERRDAMGSVSHENGGHEGWPVGVKRGSDGTWEVITRVIGREVDIIAQRKYQPSSSAFKVYHIYQGFVSFIWGLNDQRWGRNP